MPTKSTPFIGSIENIFNDESFSRDTLTLGITVKWKFQVNTLYLMGFPKLVKTRLKINRVKGKQARCDYSNGVYNQACIGLWTFQVNTLLFDGFSKVGKHPT